MFLFKFNFLLFNQIINTAHKLKTFGDLIKSVTNNLIFF